MNLEKNHSIYTYEVKNPVVLIFFKRFDSTMKILEVIKRVRPRKLYLLSDGGRNKDEHELVTNLRKSVEEFITWNCTIIKFYQSKNVGVYSQIALGAKKIFNIEEKAIFLEDDNLPEVTFFQYCDELLDRYKNDEKIFWICGTNYQRQIGNGNPSYYFTRQLLPCGWASWSEKFLKYYDFDFTNYKKLLDKSIRKLFFTNRLFNQQIESIKSEIKNQKTFGTYTSWDFHVISTLYSNNLYGISPYKNQITNIGVDSYSIHGGVSFKNPMTKRFCFIKTDFLEFPLSHPRHVIIDKNFERITARTILYPYSFYIRLTTLKFFSRLLRIIFRVPSNKTIKQFFFKNK